LADTDILLFNGKFDLFVINMHVAPLSKYVRKKPKRKKMKTVKARGGDFLAMGIRARGLRSYKKETGLKYYTSKKGRGIRAGKLRL
jgi:hypothetical protein